jgi:diadenosine tetraphosphate (Ap4A) HIT family hydrolase
MIISTKEVMIMDMFTDIHRQVEEAKAGKNPAVVCRVPSGWVVLNDQQFLPGYCVLLPDPVVGTINDLNQQDRMAYLSDMVVVGDALLEVTNTYRINYAILGNTAPALHAHVTPRYLSEPDANRKIPIWNYPPEIMNSRMFDPLRDKGLQESLAAAIQKRLNR